MKLQYCHWYYPILLYIIAVALLHSCSVICVISDPVHNLVINSCIDKRHIHRFAGLAVGFINGKRHDKASNTNQGIPGHKY